MHNKFNSAILPLTQDLCTFATGVVSPEDAAFFDRVAQELPIKLRRYAAGSVFNGWVVPQRWCVEKAVISQNGRTVFDGKSNPLGVAAYSKSFQGEVDLDELKLHLVTNRSLPTAYVYHCMWQYRPWAADWAFCMPYEIFTQLESGRYTVDLITRYESGEMLVAEYEHRGRSEETIVFAAHTCHPCMANDDFAGVAVLLRLFQWLREQDTYYSYRLILGPEHIGTVFYLQDLSEEELQRLVSGAFLDMPGTCCPLKIASTFLGNQVIDRAFRHAAKHCTKAFEVVPWRRGAGNDETVWEAPGYEVPFVEVSRCADLLDPYPEYHTNLDCPELMDEEMLAETFDVFAATIRILEGNARLFRKFNGLLCLSNPEYDLYFERPDPSITKNLADDSEKWGYLLDCLLRYLDGSVTILDIAEKHDLPFDRLYQYLFKFQEKDLVRFEFAAVERRPISKPDRTWLRQ